jgi:hypothetical protein
MPIKVKCNSKDTSLQYYPFFKFYVILINCKFESILKVGGFSN